MNVVELHDVTFHTQFAIEVRSIDVVPKALGLEQLVVTGGVGAVFDALRIWPDTDTEYRAHVCPHAIRDRNDARSIVPLQAHGSVHCTSIVVHKPSDIDVLDNFASLGAFSSHDRFLNPEEISNALVPQLFDFAARGILATREEFGDVSFALAATSTDWEWTVGIAAGPATWLPALEPPGKRFHEFSKLSLAMQLLRSGFRPRGDLRRTAFLERGQPLVFQCSRTLSMPRTYFLVLCKMKAILDIYGRDFHVHHCMLDSYYLSLLRTQCKQAALEFKVLVDCRRIEALQDSDLSAFAGSQETLGIVEELFPTVPFVPGEGESDLGVEVRDEKSKAIAMQVFIGKSPPGAPVKQSFDIPSYAYFHDPDYVVPEEGDHYHMTIYYDHSSSNTGEQRAWVECEKCRQERRDRAEEKTHPACFKYLTR